MKEAYMIAYWHKFDGYTIEEIIEISNKMNELNGVLMNCTGTPQADIILSIWKGLRETLIDKIEHLKTTQNDR